MSTTAFCFRNDALSKVTGKAKYADDLKFHNMLHAVPVYTDFVHAKINHIDTTAAEQSKGVVKVITWKDVLGKLQYGQIEQDYCLFAHDKIRFHGDVIALVIATTREQAINASKKVTLDATPLPLILDTEEAMQTNSPLVHESKKSNVVNHHKIRRGNIEKGFQESSVVIEKSFTTQFIEHSYLEPESALCNPRSDGVMEVYGSMQHPFSTRRFTAALLAMPLSDVEVFHLTMGGGFGGKDDTAAIVCARTALAAKLTGKPVKMTYDREWSIRESYKRHPYKVAYKMGVTKSGKINAVECRIVADAGAYLSVTPWVTWRSTVQCCGPYEVPNVHCDAFGVHTNHNFTGAMRGFGSPQMNFVIEQMVEMAARKLGLSEIEFREKNRVRQGSTTITEQKLDQHTVSMGEVLQKVVHEIEYDKKRTQCSFGKSDTNELYGIGLAMSYRGMSLGAEGFDFCSAIINGQWDGSILLEVAQHENGQGCESAMMLILADALGIDRRRIRYRRASTSNIPDGGTTVASRATLMGGGAITIAAQNLKTLMANTLADVLHCKADEVHFANDCLWNADKTSKLTWSEAMQHMMRKQTYPYAFGVFQAPQVSWDEETGKGNAYFTWVYGCQAVELSVHKKTGKVKLLNYVAAHDVGKAINPPMLLGQFYGGITQGIGYALFESLDVKNGKIISDNFNRYHLPRATDIPDITGIIVENADPLSPSKAKGIGEPALELAAPAIANAIYHATGKRYFDLPIRVNDGE
ncbi:MAG: xanthine dehydrogenase family protein molybdopterin-binding subunit [Pseudomonadota bacterium]|nr:xanthine dehydrogenase family protein molybdopterin-binding subunit [Gammaproteobacteria bacterium]